MNDPLLRLCATTLKERSTGLLSIVGDVHSSYSKEIEKRFNEGKATCTYAVFVLGRELENQGVPFQVVEGEFLGQGHWWIVAEEEGQEWILDIGDNISPNAIETGVIEGKIVSIQSQDYQEEDRMSFNEYLDHYEEIKGF